MKCPNCQDVSLASQLTMQGVDVDRCSRCHGVWLEQGEIYYFTNNRRRVDAAIREAMRQARASDRLSPKTGNTMRRWTLFAGSADKVQLDSCPDSGGIWFDGQELDAVTAAARSRLALSVDRASSPPQAFSGTKPALLKLPNLALRSVSTLVALYGVLVLLMITAVQFADLEVGLAVLIGFAIAAVQFLLGPWLMDLALRFLYHMDWLEPDQLPSHLKVFLETVCGRLGMKLPSIGLIHDGAPNAFTYGHQPDNARIVISQGLLDLLEREEVEAVVAHEVGHAKHWDMLVMTIVQLVPLILYYLYKLLLGARKSGSQRGKGSGYQAAVAVGAYVLYIVSQYVVLWFSRTREYYADRFAGRVTRDPNLLSRALVKIAYGLAGKDGKKGGKRSSTMEAVGALGIFDPGAARAVALAGYPGGSGGGSSSGGLDKKEVVGAMKWDLWNPWAKYYELHSTHPLIANRIKYLGNQAEAMGREPFVRFDLRRPESYWDEFVVDLLVMWLPLIAAGPFIAYALLASSKAVAGMALAAAAAGGLIKLTFSSAHGLFPEMRVASLLRAVKVSAVRPVPCTITGTIIGRGVPGLIWSEDFVMKDDSGIVFLDYRQPLRIWEFLFGLLRASKLQNQAATVTGWYRRAPIPYIEIKSMTTADRKRTCWVYHMKLVSWVALLLIAILVVVA